MHHIVYNTLQHKMKSSSSIAIIVWVVGVGATASRRVIELVPLWVTGRRCKENLHRLKNIKMKDMKDYNNRKHTRAPRGNPKWGSVGEVGTVSFEFLAVVPFAIHVTMQWISFESIAKCSIANKIVKWANMKDCLLLSEGRHVEVIPLSHFFVPLPHFFVLPPHFFIPLP
jgi:hypothetical protein